MTDGTTTWNYTYDANGMRTSRSNGTKTYNYVYNGSQLTQMTVGNDTLYFTYGVLGPTTVTWNGTTYYYALNAQGDVVGIYDHNSYVVVTYNWDTAWGCNPIPEGSLASTLGALNPLRYRSYVYDTETGYYYLQSRYYDPEIGRFINADGLVATGQGFVGNNMFAYCGNNPVNCVDPSGNCWKSIFEIIKSTLLLVEAVKTVVDKISNTFIPPGGETVYEGQVRICTDGSDGTLVEDRWWRPDTALQHNGKPLDACTVYYVVVPLDVYHDDNGILGCCALLINHDTGMRVWCIAGELGPDENGWGEVSIAAIWDTGNPDHMTANTAYGLGYNYEIILYRNLEYKFRD